MAIETSEVRSVLNDLIQTCRDGEEGFRDAVTKVTRVDLKTLFSEYSTQRAGFASQLQSQVAKLGGEPDNSGSLSGAIHRGWLNLKGMVTGSDDSAIVAECERGEDAAVRAYREALTKDVPTEIRTLLESQYREVQEAHNKVRALEVRTQKA